MDAIRAYLHAIRHARKISQRTLAERIGLSERAWIDWETGKTADLKASVLIKTVAILGASLGDVAQLLEMDADSGTQAAQRLIEGSTMDNAIRLELNQVALKVLAHDPALASVLSVLAERTHDQSTPAIVRTFLRADRKLSTEDAIALADMFDVMYATFVKVSRLDNITRTGHVRRMGKK